VIYNDANIYFILKDEKGFCEERSDEAISLKLQGVRDCFASLAMTTYIASIFRKHSASLMREYLDGDRAWLAKNYTAPRHAAGQ